MPFKYTGTVTITGTTGPFVVCEKFVVGMAGITFLSRDFVRQFLGKIEKPIPGTTLCYGPLINFSMKVSILAELGDKAETMLTHVYMLMEQRAHGEEGALLVGKHANIFCVRDVENYMRAVLVFRRLGGWAIGTHPILTLRGWNNESRVFRNS